MPRLAKWLIDGIEVPHESYPISEVEDAPAAIWWIDNFGNAKTTLLPQEVGHEPGKSVKMAFGEIKCYHQLRDVPVGETGLTIGSSGLGDKRFLEIVVQGKKAVDEFSFKVGQEIL
jgi:hypothetical protein